MPEDKKTTNQQANGGHGKGKNTPDQQDIFSAPENGDESSKQDLNPEDSSAKTQEKANVPANRPRKKGRRAKKGASKKQSNSGFAFAASKEKSDANLQQSPNRSAKNAEKSRRGSLKQEKETRETKQDSKITAEKQPNRNESSENLEESATEKKPKGIFSAFFSFKKVTPKHEHHSTLAVRERHEVTPQEPISTEQAPAEPNGKLGGEFAQSNQNQEVTSAADNGVKKGFFRHLIDEEDAQENAESHQENNSEKSVQNSETNNQAGEDSQELAEKNHDQSNKTADQNSNSVALPAGKTELSLPENKLPLLLAAPIESEENDSFVKLITDSDDINSPTEQDNALGSSKQGGLLRQLAFWKKKPDSSPESSNREAASEKVIFAVRKQKSQIEKKAEPVAKESEQGLTEVESPQQPAEKEQSKKRIGFLQKFGLGKKRKLSVQEPIDRKINSEKVILAIRNPAGTKTAVLAASNIPEHDNSFHAVAADYAEQSTQDLSNSIVETRAENLEMAEVHLPGIEHFDDRDTPTPKQASFWGFTKKNVPEAPAEDLETAALLNETELEQEEVSSLEVKQLLEETERSEEELEERSSESILQEFATEEEQNAIQNILAETERNNEEEPKQDKTDTAKPSFFSWNRQQKASDMSESAEMQTEDTANLVEDAGNVDAESDQPIAALPKAQSEKLMLESHEVLLLDMPHEQGIEPETLTTVANPPDEVLLQNKSEADASPKKKRRGFLQLFANKNDSKFEPAETAESPEPEATQAQEATEKTNKKGLLQKLALPFSKKTSANEADPTGKDDVVSIDEAQLDAENNLPEADSARLEDSDTTVTQPEAEQEAPLETVSDPVDEDVKAVSDVETTTVSAMSETGQKDDDEQIGKLDDTVLIKDKTEASGKARWGEKISSFLPKFGKKQNADQSDSERQEIGTDFHNQNPKVIFAVRKSAVNAAAITPETALDQSIAEAQTEKKEAHDDSEQPLQQQPVAELSDAEGENTEEVSMTSDKEQSVKQGLLAQFTAVISGKSKGDADPNEKVASQDEGGTVDLPNETPPHDVVESETDTSGQEPEGDVLNEAGIDTEDSLSPKAEQAATEVEQGSLDAPLAGESADIAESKPAKKGLLQKLALPFSKKTSANEADPTGKDDVVSIDESQLDPENNLPEVDSARLEDSDTTVTQPDAEQEAPLETASDAVDEVEKAVAAEIAESSEPEATQAQEATEKPNKKGLLQKLSLPFSKKTSANEADPTGKDDVVSIDEAQLDAENNLPEVSEAIAQIEPTADSVDSQEKSAVDISDEELLGIAEDENTHDTETLNIAAAPELAAEFESDSEADDSSGKKKKLFGLFQKKKKPNQEKNNELSFLASHDADNQSQESNGSAFELLFQPEGETKQESPKPLSLEQSDSVISQNQDRPEQIAPELEIPVSEAPAEPQRLADPNESAEQFVEVDPSGSVAEENLDSAAEPSVPNPEVMDQAESSDRPDVLVQAIRASNQVESEQPAAPIEEARSADQVLAEPKEANSDFAAPEEESAGGSNILELRALPNEEEAEAAASLPVPEPTPMAQEENGEARNPLMSLLPESETGQRPDVSMASEDTSGTPSDENNPLLQGIATPEQQLPAAPAQAMPEQVGGDSSAVGQATDSSTTQQSPTEKKNPFASILNRFGMNKGEQQEAGSNATGTGLENNTENGQPEQATSEPNPFVQGNEENPFVSGLVGGVQISEKNESKVLGEKFSAHLTPMMRKRQEEAKKRKGEYMIVFSKFVAGLSLLAPLASWVIFQTMLDADSKFSEVLKAKNYGIEMNESTELLEQKSKELKQLAMAVSNATKQIENIKNNKILAEIIENRVDFLEIMLRINRITLKSLSLTPELNSAINMLVFNSYSGRMDGDSVGISINGTVRDPKRMSWSKLTQLMETINKDEFFSGASIRSFSKTDDDEGGSRSSFSFNFSYLPPLKDELLSAAPAK